METHNGHNMSEREDVLQRIYLLMDEQVRTLRSELTADEILQYGQRKRQIAELIDRLSRNGHSQ
jgi:hypothetical protein